MRTVGSIRVKVQQPNRADSKLPLILAAIPGTLFAKSDHNVIMDPIKFHPRDIEDSLSRRFPLRDAQSYRGGKTAMMLYSHSDEVARLNEIIGVLILARGKPTADGGSPEFEIDLSDLKPLQEGPGVPFGALVDRPVKLSHTGSAGVWSCEFRGAAGNHTCVVRANGKDIIEYEVDGQVTKASAFDQRDRDFLSNGLYTLNKALDAYCRIHRL